MANLTVKVCYRNSLKIASIVCHVVSYSSRTERLLTRQSWLKTGLPPTAVSSLEKTNGHRTHGPQPSWLSYLWSFQPKLNTIDELKKVLQSTWDDLPQNSINKAILNIVKKLRACVKAGARHFELNTSWDKLFSQSFELVASDVFFRFQYKHYDENCNFHSQCFTW